MPQVDARKAGRKYKGPEGRKEKDGTTSVIKLETLQTRAQNLISLKIAAGQAAKAYAEAVKAVAEASGLLSATVSRYISARAGSSFLEQREKAAQMALVFDELGELDAPPEGKAPSNVQELFEKDPANHADPDASLG